jgi:hypothetical protein
VSRLRLTSAALAALVLAGCGGAAHVQPRQPPRLPHALAQQWRGEADRIAAALAAGDGCSARQDAVALRTQVIEAVNTRMIPARLLEPLTSAVNSLPERITCTPVPDEHEKKPKHEKHGHGHGHGGEGGDG